MVRKEESPALTSFVMQEEWRFVFFYFAYRIVRQELKVLSIYFAFSQ